MGTNLKSISSQYFASQTDASSLAFFRICFGLLMCISMVRFWYLGWIEKLYLTPKFHFKYQWMDWVVVPGEWTYLLFIVCGFTALMVAIGYKYHVAIVLFFLSFTYIELMDKTTYLNHYYLVSLLSFLLLLLPANCMFSVDAAMDERVRFTQIPSWMIDSLKVMVAIVYISAGLAKLNPDWILKAMPLALWLQSKTDIPVIGQLMHHTWLHYVFSWGGALYDLCIIPLLLFARTRMIAFVAVVVFHVLTKVLFPIGMFPYIMIMATLLFFRPRFHRRILEWVSEILGLSIAPWRNHKPYISSRYTTFVKGIFTVFLFVQIVFPLRSIFLTDNVYWTERGYRFSWRVMLMEKTGHADFKIVNTETGKRFYVDNSDFLTAFQQKQMSTQPDFILEYGHYLGNHFTSQGHENIGVFVDSYVALNGRRSQQYIDPNVDLMSIHYTELIENHILSLLEK